MVQRSETELQISRQGWARPEEGEEEKENEKETTLLPFGERPNVMYGCFWLSAQHITIASRASVAAYRKHWRASPRYAQGESHCFSAARLTCRTLLSRTACGSNATDEWELRQYLLRLSSE